MKTLRLNQSHKQVTFLQKILQKKGYLLPVTGNFDKQTEEFVKDFQKQYDLGPDGIVGENTWKQLLSTAYNFRLGAQNYILNDDEWFKNYTEKDTIYIHHTAGLHRPDFTIDWWEKDNAPQKLNRVGTSFVIGRASLNGDKKWDGITYRAFSEIYWAHHLGTKFNNNKWLNKKSIGIEICALGPLVFENGNYLFKSNFKEMIVPEETVCKLDKPWRGFSFFQKYTEKQIEECRRLILTLSYLFEIPLKNVNYNHEWFEIDQNAIDGKPGLWTHCNVRNDKTDCFPQLELIAMLNGLFETSKTFVPEDRALESVVSRGVVKNSLENIEIEHYTEDLNPL